MLQFSTAEAVLLLTLAQLLAVGKSKTWKQILRHPFSVNLITLHLQCNKTSQHYFSSLHSLSFLERYSITSSLLLWTLLDKICRNIPDILLRGQDRLVGSLKNNSNNQQQQQHSRRSSLESVGETVIFIEKSNHLTLLVCVRYSPTLWRTDGKT